MKVLENVLSLKNEYKDGTRYKVLKVLGVKLKHKTGRIENNCECELEKYNPDIISDLEDGFMRLRVSHKCNCKCYFCYQQFWSEEDQNESMPKEWLYDLLRPLYDRVKIIHLGGGRDNIC